MRRPSVSVRRVRARSRRRTCNTRCAERARPRWRSAPALPYTRAPLSSHIALASCRVCAVAVASGLFRDDLSLSEFARGFSLYHPEVVAGKRRRFVDYLDAARAGTLLQRPPGPEPAWRARQHVREPMPYRLQSSDTDCAFEFARMRSAALTADAACKFVAGGGDGLTMIRAYHAVARDKHKYLDTAPALLPILGEQPHGAFHITHAGHRVRPPSRHARLAVRCPSRRSLLASPLALHAYATHDHCICTACAAHIHIDDGIRPWPALPLLVQWV